MLDTCMDGHGTFARSFFALWFPFSRFVQCGYYAKTVFQDTQEQNY